jgi:hypothetical protein
MTGTGQSGTSAAGVVDGPPPRFWQALVATGTAMASLAWATAELAGSFPWGVLGGTTGAALALWWRTRRDRERWPEQRAVDRALRDHRDPGPAYRAAADKAARERLARRTTFEDAVVALLLGGPAVACLVVAVVREDLTVALPVIPLTVLAVSGVRFQRRQDRDADRWLADPPTPPGAETA